jgi:adenylylsulfate kinase-like enzyme
MIHRGLVVWITGLSGAGKSSIAQQLVTVFEEKGQQVIYLDGDAVRLVINDPHISHDRESRLKNALRICRLAELLSKQGFTVIVATMSLFREVFAFNRERFPAYFEVYLQADLAHLQKRDARGLYSRAARGEASHVVGIDLPFDAPEHPHLTITNNGDPSSVSSLAEAIYAALPPR